MILVDQDGRQFLHYADWTAEMMFLSNRLADLPRRPGSTVRSSHPLGIDRLHNDNRGRDRLAVTLLAASSDELEWRPDKEEVVAIGQALLALNRELNQLLRDRRRNRRASQDRRAKVLRDANESNRTPIFGFRRGPRAGGPKQS